MGFRIRHQNLPEYKYGWIRLKFLQRKSDGIPFIRIKEYAYFEENTKPIMAGQIIIPIPEPTSASLGLLALGAVGLRRFRKQRVSA